VGKRIWRINLMATVTPNFNWPVPTSTDLVKDGATAIEALGDSIDASMVDLKGGTTGQVLSKASNTDMDFTWSSTSGDIEGVTVTSPLTGGGTSGTVTVGILSGTTSNLGAVQLSDSTSSTSTTLAATANAVKTTFDLANAALPKLLTFNAQTGTTYTLVAGDATKLVTTSNASAVTVTIPPSVFSAGQQINVQSIGVGLTTFAAGSGVTITSTGASAAAPVLRARYSAATVICTASNTFTVIGDLS
jgi:hypothetical protein